MMNKCFMCQGGISAQGRIGIHLTWSPTGLWRNILIVALGIMMGSCLWVGPVMGSASDQPQELPKPFHKTTPPLFQEWNFNNSAPQGFPKGFMQATEGNALKASWVVNEDASAPSRPGLVEQHLQCGEKGCYHLMLAEDVVAEYVDLSVRIKLRLGTPSGKAGLAYGVQDSKNFYAVVVEPKSNMVVAYVVKDGIFTELAKEPLIPENSEWHTLRLQRNTIISKEFTEIFFDHHLILDVYDQSFKKGQIGLVAMGDGAFAFDNLRAMELMSNRPLSRPSAY